jgi:hypothetical protein
MKFFIFKRSPDELKILMTGIAATPVVVECNSAKYCILLKTKIVGDDVITVKNFASGLLTFDWENLPTEVHFLVHIFLAFSLLARWC